MKPVAALIIGTMFSGENAQTWLEKGTEAYANMRLDEAGQDFQKAVEADPRSAKAQLSLGVIYFFKYLNGVAEQPDLPDDYVDRLNKLPPGSPPPAPPPLPLDRSAKRTAQITEENLANGAMAEDHLKKAVELEPRYEQAIEYLGALYFSWRDPATDHRARRDEARRWYMQLSDINPHHPFANYVCGVIDYDSAFAIIRSTPGFPRSLSDEKSRRSLRAKVGPLLSTSAKNFQRSLEIDPNNSDAMTYLGLVRSAETYIADSTDESVRLKAEAAEWYRKWDQIMEAQAKATGQPWPPDENASITFDRIPGKVPIPPFPPDSRFWIGPAPPPPPPAFRR